MSDTDNSGTDLSHSAPEHGTRRTGYVEPDFWCVVHGWIDRRAWDKHADCDDRSVDTDTGR